MIVTLHTQRAQTLGQVHRVAASEERGLRGARARLGLQLHSPHLGAVRPRGGGQGGQGRGQGVPYEDDGAVACTVDPAGTPVPRERTCSRPSRRWPGAALREALHGGGRALARRGGRGAGAAMRPGHSRGASPEVRALRRCTLRASGGTVERAPVQPAPIAHLPLSAHRVHQDPTPTGSAGDCYDNAWPRASSPPSKANSSTGVRFRLGPKRAPPSSNSSRVGTTPNAVIPGWGT